MNTGQGHAGWKNILQTDISMFSQRQKTPPSKISMKTKKENQKNRDNRERRGDAVSKPHRK
jgi:hypothetical protein